MAAIEEGNCPGEEFYPESDIVDMDENGTPNFGDEDALFIRRQTEEYLDDGVRYAFQQ